MTSICLATYNGERFIEQQIDSILCQLDENDELIISDDGSTDRTLEIIESYNDSRIKIFHHSKNSAYANVKHSKGFYYASENFENALKQAKGDYIFLSDQDDVWCSDKKNKMILALKEYDCVHCKNSVIDENNNQITGMPEKDKSKKSVLYNLMHTPFLGCCMALKKETLEYVLPFPKKCIGHDLWIGCLCAYKNKLIYIDEYLHKYRVHSFNVSPTVSKKSKNSLFYKISYRITFLFQFYKRVLFNK